MKDREPILIAYFAIKGKEESAATAKVAAKLGQKLTEKGVAFDSFAIVPTEEYPSDPANFELVTKAEKERHARPELVGTYSGMKEVKDIFLIVPNWWNSLPQGVFTFLDKYDFSEKRMVPVVLHSGDGADDVVNELRNFIHKVWVMKEVVIKDSDVENCEAEIDKAVDEMFRPSTSKF